MPPTPAKILEIGAGGGELAQELTTSGYDLVAIDPEPGARHVRKIPLHELAAPADDFDAAVAVISLHHVQPLSESSRRLAEVVKPGGVLIIDEFDVDSFDGRAARWWLDNRHTEGEEEHTDPDELVAELRGHLHPLRGLLETLGQWFRFEDPARGPYLYRWDLPEGLLDEETRLIADGLLPATGARVVGTRV